MIKLRHDFHRRINMVKEFLIGRAEVVEPPFALWRPCETMLWAFAVTGKTYTTCTRHTFGQLPSNATPIRNGANATIYCPYIS